MEQVVYEFARGAAIGGCGVLCVLLALAALRERVLRWAATLLGQHQGGNVSTHGESF